MSKRAFLRAWEQHRRLQSGCSGSRDPTHPSRSSGTCKAASTEPLNCSPSPTTFSNCSSAPTMCGSRENRRSDCGTLCRSSFASRTRRRSGASGVPGNAEKSGRRRSPKRWSRNASNACRGRIDRRRRTGPQSAHRPRSLRAGVRRLVRCREVRSWRPRKRYIGRRLGRVIRRMLARRSSPTRHVRAMIWRTEKATRATGGGLTRRRSSIRDG